MSSNAEIDDLTGQGESQVLEFMQAAETSSDLRAATEESWDVPFTAAGDMIAEMVEADSMMITRPLLLFIDNWNYMPHRRMDMLAGEPPHDADRFLLAALASVVHSLCDRDGLPLPDWAAEVSLVPEATLSGGSVATPFGKHVKAVAPSPCEKHGVYFEEDLLNRTSLKMRQIG